jgi:histidinol-phosphate aminotransferase
VGLLDYYRQFSDMPEDEIRAALREQARERREKALARIEPLDLSATTWPRLPHPDIVAAITYAARGSLNRAPDPHASKLRLELARRHALEAERVVVGHGAAQLMSAAARALLEPGDELLTPWPSYALLPRMARDAGARAVPLEGASTPAAILAGVTDRTRIVALCNPNDPTGGFLALDQVQELLRGLPERAWLLLDEALRDYVDAEDPDASLQLLDAFPRLLIFRTFSKAWGLAGLRCGYALGGPGAEPLLEQLAPELGVNELAHAVALEALRTPRIIERRRAIVARHRAELTEQLRERGLDVAPSQTNFVWLPAPGPHGAADLTARLGRSGITVRSGAAVGAPDRVRVTVPHRPEDVERLLRALDAAASG